MKQEKAQEKNERTYGYTDKELVTKRTRKTPWLQILLAIILITGVWLALDQKLLTGKSWISNTYDHPDWRTNEGNLRTYGAWDIETHIWKTEYIMENYPNYHWNPYWYLGMPLIKYYPIGFYALNAGLITITDMDAARSTLLLTIYGHLAAALALFWLCYKISRRVWPSALSAIFLLASTFISLRSYGWEPITVVFLALFPLSLLVFLKEPLRPLRIGMVLMLTLSYLSHPLIWLVLCITMGVYLLSIALRKNDTPQANSSNYLWQLIILVMASLAIGAVQFIPQITYEQVTSGAHMGVTYLPYYQIPFNIINPIDFLFDAGNLKGPGPIVAIALFFGIYFGISAHKKRKKERKEGNTKRTTKRKDLFSHELLLGIFLVLVVMIALYYFERFRIFPMNLLQSTQYHRVIPEIIMIAAIFLAGLSNIINNRKQKILYYAILISFALASMIVVYNVQNYWVTSEQINDSKEFIHEEVQGRITFPYTDQSLSVRNSFTKVPQLYGYYEQGITNPYADEGFSVSSGFHDREISLLYLQAMNIGRLYVNTEEGKRDQDVIRMFNRTMELTQHNDRYSYFNLELPNPSYAQTVSAQEAKLVQKREVGCRELFKVNYCGSKKEEFVSKDKAEITYLQAYQSLLSRQQQATVEMEMIDPDHYTIRVDEATTDTAVVVKMTYDKEFSATINGEKQDITTIGPYFMIITPGKEGNYQILLEYEPRLVKTSAAISIIALLAALILTVGRKRIKKIQLVGDFKKGDM